jgi:hypothetical protein
VAKIQDVADVLPLRSAFPPGGGLDTRFSSWIFGTTFLQVRIALRMKVGTYGTTVLDLVDRLVTFTRSTNPSLKSRSGISLEPIQKGR